MSKIPPERSKGARMERAAMRAYIRRKLSHDANNRYLQEVLAWVLARQKRYNDKAGGLGRA